eukprot:593834_1
MMRQRIATAHSVFKQNQSVLMMNRTNIIYNLRCTFAAEPYIPTTLQPGGFRAYDKPVRKKGKQSFNGRYDPFKPIHHQRAQTQKEFQFDPKEVFNIHPFWTPLVPAIIIGTGIYTIVSGLIANPPSDDDDDD